MNLDDIQINESDDKDIRDAILAGLVAYNAPYLGLNKAENFSLYMTDDSSKVIAGICGSMRQYMQSKIVWIQYVWVDEAYRRQGLATKLFQKLEDYAKSKDCTVIQLDTFDFQAKPLYEKLGYECVGTIPKWIEGRDGYYLRKTLTSMSGKPF